MRDNDGRKLSHEALEAMRLRAVEQVRAGVHPEDVAAALGLHRSTVFGWVARFREGGRQALRARPIPGRPRSLSAEQVRRLYALVVGRDPGQLQFPFRLWTREMVRVLISREFAVELSVVTVGRLLRTLGLLPQRTLPRAYHDDPDARARWKRDQYPTIRAEAAAAGAAVFFCDGGQTGRTSATRGGRSAVNLLSAVAAKGALRFAAYEGDLGAAVFIDFCERLLHDAGTPVLLVVDGQRAQRSAAVQKFAESTDGRLRIFPVP